MSYPDTLQIADDLGQWPDQGRVVAAINRLRQLDTLTRTLEATATAAQADRDAARADAESLRTDRDGLADQMAALTADREAVRSQLAAAAADRDAALARVAELTAPPPGVPVSKARVLLSRVAARLPGKSAEVQTAWGPLVDRLTALLPAEYVETAEFANLAAGAVAAGLLGQAEVDAALPSQE